MTWTPLPIQPRHPCFACGHDNPVGLRMEFSTDGQRVVSRLRVPRHMCGWREMAHGGIVATVLDEVMGNAAIYLLERIVVTRSIQIDFTRPVQLEVPIEAGAQLSEKLSDREAVMVADIKDADGNLCASARGFYALFIPEAFRRLGLADTQGVIDDFEHLMRMSGKKT